MGAWDAAQYLRFEAERTQPAVDLARRIPLGRPQRILDVGCGPGNSSRVLARTFPEAAVCGIDSSEAMIARARADHPDLSFRVCDAATDLPTLGGGFDVVFSNACIQWIPNHPALVKNLLALLRPGGILAVQTPMNEDAPIHRIIRELVTGETWRGYFPQPRIFHNLTPPEYYGLLAGSASDVAVWETVYYHVLGSPADILEWYRGTGLRPYLAVLPDGKKEAFEAEVFDRVRQAYPPEPGGDILFRFARFFFMARARDGAS